MVQFGSLITSIIYIGMLLHIHSQYTTIWSDDMNQNNGWTASSSSQVSFAYDSGGCFTSLCTRTTFIDPPNPFDVYIYRSTSVAAYATLQLQVDVSCVNLEPGDTCRVSYGWSQSDKNDIKSWSDCPDLTRNKYPNQIIDLPDASNADHVWIWLGSHNAENSNTGDPCYWDNVVLRGILAPTKDPTGVTADPSSDPSSGPTNDPSSGPSSDPSSDPTNDPSSDPSNDPSNPSSDPTKYPSVRPTESPTRDPFEYEETEDNVQFTIEIKLNSCTNDGSEPCAFDVTED
eukprot:173248_1